MHPPDAPPPGATLLEEMLEDLLRRRYLVVDGQGRISRWSSGAEQLLGWQEQEVVGRSAFGQPLAWTGGGLALWQAYFEATQGARPPEEADLMMLCRGGWGLWVETTAVPVPLVLGYEFTMLVADLAGGGPGFDSVDRLTQLHPLASDAIASALDAESPPVDAVAGLLVTLRPVSEAAVIEDTDAQHAARALAMECEEQPATAHGARVAAPAPEPEPEPAHQPEATEPEPATPDPELETLRARLEQVESERDSLRAELQALPGQAAVDAARRDRDEARANLAAALAERDRAAEALSDATQQRDAAAAALRQAEAERDEVTSEREAQADELRLRLEEAERIAAERAAEVEAATREAAEQRERVAAGHLATEALARERARVSELESQIARLSGRLDRAESREAIPRKRPFESGLDDIDSPRAYIGLDGRFTALNDGFCKLVGYSEAEFSTAYWPPIIDAEHRSALRRATARLIDGKLSSSEVDTFYMSGHGDLVRVVGTLRLDRDESGAARRLVLDAQPLSAVTA